MSKRGLILILIATSLLVAAGSVWGGRVTRPTPDPAEHELACEACHGGGVTLYGVGNGATNICLQCHTGTPTGTTTTLGNLGPARTVTTRMNPNDASDALGTLSAQGFNPSEQTSHNWASDNVINPAAGATSAPSFYASGESMGRLTCATCHDPHLNVDVANPSLLRTLNTNDALCLDCHVGFDAAITTNPTTHPVNVAMPGASSATDSTVTDPDGNVALIGGMVSCSTCHRTHGADSDRSTDDGISDAARSGGPLSAGDGKMLVTDGANAADPGYLCQTCHTYQGHGPSEMVKCLDCHGGHPDPTAPTANIEMLRYSTMSYTRITGSLSATEEAVTGMSYPDGATAWMNAGTGYCESCHDMSAHAVYPAGWGGDPAECGQCHGHDNATFGGACNSCHGYSPSTTARVGAAPETGPYDETINADPPYTNFSEGTTPHINHADPQGLKPEGGLTNHNFQCQTCHVNFATAHNDGWTAADFGFDTTITGGAATFGGAPTGTCNNVYCHTNGNGGAAASVNWNGGRRSAALDCASCHGNSDATMVSKSNSTSHRKHIDATQSSYGKAYTCNVCHNATASNNTTLKDNGTTFVSEHVNGTKDVEFDTTYSLGAADLSGNADYASNGCAAVYCHSNGKGNYVQPDWAAGTGGACGDCHQVNASGDSGQALSYSTAPVGPLKGAHDIHVFNNDGPQLSCSECHGANANTGDHAGHLNGDYNDAVSLPVNCDTCHGVDGAEATPVWSNPQPVSDCVTCHTGASVTPAFTNAAGTQEVSGDAADTKNSFLTWGHGDSNLSSAANGCTGCHDAAAVGHFDADDTDLRLLDDPNGDLTDNLYTTDASVWCQECHAQNAHFNDSLTADGTSHSGDACATCHEPHGDGTIRPASDSANSMLMATINAKPVVNYDKSDGKTAGDFFEADPVGTSTYGICQVCHDSAEVGHYNTVTSDGHNSGTVCTTCHTHTNTPAFPGGECFSCHGNGTDSYWPDTAASNIRGGTNNSDYDDDGAHTKHITEMASQIMGQTLAQLRTDNAGVGTVPWDTATSDAKQKELCGYCHEIGDGDHATKAVASHAEVFPVGGKKRIWDGAADADVTFDNTTNFTCATADCHNGKTTTAAYNWYAAPGASACVMCHNDIEVTTAGTTGATHQAHVDAATLFGVTVTCAACHDAATEWDSGGPTYVAPANNHINGTLNVAGSGIPGYTGTYTDFDTQTFGSCGTNNCHNDGTGTGAPAAYTWGTAAANCTICHVTAFASGGHEVHLNDQGTGTQYGPKLGTSSTTPCTNCHEASATNNSMASMGTHINGTLTFRNIATPASPYEVTSGQIGTGNDAVDTCDACHGGNASVNVATNGAKDAWVADTRVSCESCHKGNVAWTQASSKQAGEASPVSAPANAENYVALGHGKVLMTNDVPGTDPVTCASCHDTASAHISHALGEDRLSTVDGQDYTTSVTNFCGACHDTGIVPADGAAGDENNHYANMAGAQDSVSGDACNICHDPHGQKDKNASNLDAMLVNSIGGKDLVGFTNKATRADYYVVAPGAVNGYGVCQVCHNPNDDTAGGGAISYFNWTTADTGHNSTVCTECHQHTADPAFKGGCTSCHGAESGVNVGQIWPDADGSNNGSRIVYSDDSAGAHDNHVLTIGTYLYAAAGDTLAELRADASMQIATCAFCHPDPGGNSHDTNGGGNSRVDVFADSDDTTAQIDVFQRFAVAANTAEPDLSGANSDQAYNYTNKSCSNLSCHNDAQTPITTNDWDNPPASPDCTVCHPVASYTNRHALHVTTEGYACTECHANNGTFPGGTVGVDHLDGEVQLVWNNTSPASFSDGTNSGSFEYAFGDGAVTYSQAAPLPYKDATWGTCANAACHYEKSTPSWSTAVTNNCSICHTVTAGSHTKHTDLDANGAGNDDAYATTTVGSTAGAYDFGCGNCHSVVAANHRNGRINLSLDQNDGGTIKSLNGAADDVSGYAQANGPDRLTELGFTEGVTAVTCSTAYCHSAMNAANSARVFNATPSWYASPNIITWKGNAAYATRFSGSDPCAECHSNSPVSAAHGVHEVGIHYEDIYTGTTGLMSSGSATPASGHGDGNSTTLSCNICHSTAVAPSSERNRLNTTCASCHSGDASNATNDLDVMSKIVHVNGVKNVAFVDLAAGGSEFKSRAQLRDNLADAAEVDGNWTRTSAYKTANTDHDAAKVTPDAYETVGGAGSKNCSNISCHNGNTATWAAPASNCMACHTQLPK